MKKFFCTVSGKILMLVINLIATISLIGGGIACLAMAELNSSIGSLPETPEEAYTEVMRKRIPTSAEINNLMVAAVKYFDSRISFYLDEYHTGELINYLDFEISNSRNSMLLTSDDLVVRTPGASVEDDNSDEWDFIYIYTCQIENIGGEETVTVNYNSGRVVMPQLYSDIYRLKVRIPPMGEGMAWMKTLARVISILYSINVFLPFIIILSGLIWTVSLVLLLHYAGRRGKLGKLHGSHMDIIPSTFVLLAIVLLTVIAIALCSEAIEYGETASILIVIAVALSVFYVAVLSLILCIISRIKRNIFAKSLLIYRLCVKLFRGMVSLITRLIRALPFFWKYLLLAVFIGIVEFVFLIVLSASGELFIPIVFIAVVLTAVAMMRINNQVKRIIVGTREISKGNTDFKIDTNKLSGSLYEVAKNLNSISEGMESAVEEKLKSERMRTELITNVSHDIKTPLTSIINYSDLISKQECDNPTIVEYNRVLQRQSQRLTRLLDDLVEAAKASTGNLDVNLVPSDAGMLLSQACGEYDDKLREAGLTPVMSIPEEPVRIMADSRRMWRIFDNLLNNICKYSLTGTRVYMNLSREDDKAVVIFRNTSRDELNISEDELMQRFTRGDASRHT